VWKRTEVHVLAADLGFDINSLRRGQGLEGFKLAGATKLATSREEGLLHHGNFNSPLGMAANFGYQGCIGVVLCCGGGRLHVSLNRKSWQWSSGASNERCWRTKLVSYCTCILGCSEMVCEIPSQQCDNECQRK
jgi:hypothetical protein